MANATRTPALTYRQRCEDFGAQRDGLQQRSNRNGDLNLILILAALLALAAGALWAETILYWLAAILAASFVISFIHHDRLKRRLARYTTLFALNQEGLHRLDRHWERLPNPVEGLAAGEEEPSPAANPSLDAGTLADLDLFGEASLAHLLGIPNTPVGQETLRSWIRRPADRQTIAARQSAVAELAPLVAFRDDVGMHGRLMGDTQASYEAFIAWAERPGWLHNRVWLIWTARLLTLATLGLGIAYAYGQPVYPLLAALLLANVTILGVTARQVGSELGDVSARQGIFRAYATLFQIVGEQRFTSPVLVQLQTRLGANDSSAYVQMQRLGRMMPLVEFRRWMFFFFIDLATLWSLHTLWLLEGWKGEAGAHVREWLAALGEIEALLALAALCYDHPAWTFPELTDGSALVLEARDLAHPLLPPESAVGNDVVVGPPGSFLLVTGSNMSGKSTLLRALGVNSVLAQMGAPVCAAMLRLPTLTVASSMRVQDSLTQGVSFFMAELRRLKAIVDLADVHAKVPDRPLLFLLDEILQGTNTGERQIAARRIILHLVHSGAIGAVSTHDLSLADAPPLAAASVPVHFTESFHRGSEGPTMTFDYRLRPGIATSTNALKLMELVGLPLQD